MTMDVRLALDVNTSAVGWAAFRLRDGEPCAVIRSGVRTFSDGRDPQKGTSLAVDRREARQARTQRERKKDRKKQVKRAFQEAGLLPADSREVDEVLGSVDPFDVRRRGLDHQLTLFELGRALWHLGQRRGFKSNRIVDGADDVDVDDVSAMKDAITEMESALQEGDARTVGEWLAGRRDKGLPTTIRPRVVKNKAEYDFYFDRSMVEHEFDMLWDSQRQFYPDVLTDAHKDAVHHAMFFQRPLKEVDPGLCTFEWENNEKRAVKALPTMQRFRLLQELRNLRIINAQLESVPLDDAQMQVLMERLLAQKEVSWAGMRRALKLPKDTEFNFQRGKRKGLDGDVTSVALRKPERFGDGWDTLSLDQQDRVVGELYTNPNVDEVVGWLSQEFGLTEDAARETAGYVVPRGYARISRTAAMKIVPLMEEGCSYHEAATEVYGSHSALTFSQETGELLDELPHYADVLGSRVPPPKNGEKHGRITNPTVHIVLNQIRQVVNDFIRQYGVPQEIVVETTRDLSLSADDRQEITQAQKKRQKWNAKVTERLHKELKIVASRDDLQKFRLWEELAPNEEDRCCPYSGKRITLQGLFSARVEVEHILPFSRTLDNSIRNKTVSYKTANKDKDERTPYEAFHNNANGYRYDEILVRASALPRGKQWRFTSDAMDIFLRSNETFLDRSLNDTAYASRLAREYLSCLTPNVWVVPGHTTGLARRLLDLNSLLSDTDEKNRNDLRHHALDAFVIGIIDRSTLQKFAAANKQKKGNPDTFPLPWPTYRERVNESLQAINVSNKPDHSHHRQMSNETIYGLRSEGKVAIRKPLTVFIPTSAQEKKNITAADLITRATFADKPLQQKLLNYVTNHPGTNAEAIADYTQSLGTSH